MAKDELDDIEWLAVCTGRERAAIRKRSDIVEVPAGTVVIREGESPRWFYAVMEGDASIAIDGDVAGRVSKGEPVNELEVLRNEPAAATVTAETNLRLLVMGRREFLGTLDETPGLTRRLLMPHIPQPAAAAKRRPALVPLPAA
jgi:CRP/FNR family transcriptional regulator, cyclic AMP receptor protein